MAADPNDTHRKTVGYLLWIFGFNGSHRFYHGGRSPARADADLNRARPPGDARQRPEKVGGRFSTKAFAAPLWSSVSKQRIMWIASESSVSASPARCATFRLRFM